MALCNAWSGAFLLAVTSISVLSDLSICQAVVPCRFIEKRATKLSLNHPDVPTGLDLCLQILTPEAMCCDSIRVHVVARAPKSRLTRIIHHKQSINNALRACGPSLEPPPVCLMAKVARSPRPTGCAAPWLKTRMAFLGILLYAYIHTYIHTCMHAYRQAHIYIYIYIHIHYIIYTHMSFKGCPMLFWSLAAPAAGPSRSY